MILADPRDQETPAPTRGHGATDALSLRDATESDAAFVDGLTRLTMERYVRATWPAESDVERYFARNGFDRGATRLIRLGARDVGRVSLSLSNEGIYLENLHVLPEYQGCGIGSAVVDRVVRGAWLLARSVRLQCLRVNPALRLYLRHGFEQYDRTDTHHLLRLAVSPAAR